MQEISEYKLEIINKNIEKWKQNLLDLSKRNNMLNFRYNKKNVFKINEDLDWLHKVLLEDEKSLVINNLAIEYNLDNYEENKEFDKILTKLRKFRNSHMKEKGINTLYLTLGMLKWKESERSSDFIYSPILMIPVELSRDNKNSPFKLKIFDNQCIVNPTLQYKINADFGIEIIDIDEDLKVSDYLKGMSNQISELDGWDILEESYLGLFSFSKIALYNDLIRYKGKIEEHKIIGSIASNEDIYSDETYNEINEIDSNENALESYQVLDADSSQQEACVTAKQGYSFVMQGPPGTGKSQTITNIIAECLAVGKKVLFVSEKMAALEVVKKRLEVVGLGEFCLELHSNKANKKSVITELYNQYSQSTTAKAEDNQFLYTHENIKSELNNYTEELHRPFSPLNKSAFWYHGQLAKLSEVEIIQFKVDTIDIFDQDSLAKNGKLINELQLKQDLFPIYKETFWRNTTIRELTMNKTNDVQYHLSEILNSIRNISSTFDELHRELNIELLNIQSGRMLKNLFLKLTEVDQLLPNWFENANLDNLIEIVAANHTLSIEYQNQNLWIEKVYKTNDIVVDLALYQNSLKNLSIMLKEPIVEKLYINGVREEMIRKLRNFSENIIISNELTEKLKAIFGQNVKNTIYEMNSLNEIIKIILEGQKVPEEWIDDSRFVEQKVLTRIKDDADVHSHVVTDTKKLSKLFNKEILETNQESIISIFNERLLADENYKKSLAFTYQSGNNLTRNINDSLDSLKRVVEAGQQLKELLGFERELTLQSVNYLINICDAIAKIHYCKKEWLNDNEFLVANSKVAKFGKKLKDLESVKNEIEEIFEKDIFEFYSEDLFNRFKTKYLSTFRIFKGYLKDKKQINFYLKEGKKLNTFEEFSKWISKLHTYKKIEKEFDENETEYIDLLGNLYQGKDTNLDIININFKAIQDYLTLCQEIGYKNTKIENFLFNKDSKERIFELRDIASEGISAFGQKYQSFKKELGLLSLDNALTGLAEIQNTIELKLIWVESVLKEIQNISKYSHGTFNLNFDELVEYIHIIEEVQNKINYISINETDYKSIYGFLYEGINTDWNLLAQLSQWIQMLHNTSSILRLDQKNSFIEFMKNRTPEIDEQLRNLNIKITSLIESLNENIKFIIDIYRENKYFTGYNLKDDTDKKNILLPSFKDIINETINSISSLNDQSINLEKQRYMTFTSIEEISVEIKKIDNFNAIKKQIEDGEKRNIELFQNLYQKENTDWLDIESRIKVSKEIADSTFGCNITLSEEFIEYICSNEKAKFKRIINNINLCLDDFEKNIPYYHETFELDNVEQFGTNLEKSLVHELVIHFEKLIAEIGNLELVVKMRVLQDEYKLAGLEDFFLKVISKVQMKHSIKDIFYKSVYTIILDEIYSSSDILKKFERTKYDSYLQIFRELDKKQLGYNSIRIRNRIIEKSKEIIESRVGRIQAGVLSHENGKKKRHKPIRQLFSEMPDLLLTLKPCMLMSPLSVSEFLDADIIQFDVVIFDEASQISPEDAITPMLRGKDVIIGGDTKQLPPTKFFKAEISSDDFEEGEDDDITEFESILDLCANIMPQKNLKWHYRSRHESLISFSNRNFYNNSLYTFPSPKFTNEKQGVRYEYVNDGIYDRSGKRTNAKEADRVVDLVFNHFKENPSRSLGVIALSQAQMEEIEDKISDRLKSFPEYEEFFNEHKEDAFFVKNLENVQGDERDTIIISIGYGKDLNGVLNHNFGPINKAGGERRLNVAITRSKIELILVSSISDFDIDLKRTTSLGVKLLKEYIEFARTGKLPESVLVNNELDFDSPLEQDIYNSLVKLGYEVHSQVGSSGYKIDLAIVDPEHPGRYLLGVECDGATYHSSKSARDRDRLRQEILENLGWKIYRIWSQDWFKHKAKEIEKIKGFIGNLS